MGMGFAPTWLRPVSPLLHKTTLTAAVRFKTGHLATPGRWGSAPVGGSVVADPEKHTPSKFPHVLPCLIWSF